MNNGKLIVGILAGVAVGAALGVLFAPNKGKVTRRKIGKKGGELADDMNEKFTDLLDTLTEKFEELKTEAGIIAEKATQKIKAEKAAVETAAKNK